MTNQVNKELFLHVFGLFRSALMLLEFCLFHSSHPNAMFCLNHTIGEFSKHNYSIALIIDK